MASNVSEFIIETTTKEYESLVSVDKVRHCKRKRGQEGSVSDCDKNPGHEQFYSLNDLTVDVLPEGCRTDQWLNYIRDYSKRIVKLTVTRPNDDRQLFGTGCVVYMRYGYESDSDSDSDKFFIFTNEHVMGSQEDVRNCIVDWFYDTEDRVGVETSCGVKLVECDKKPDYCCFTVTDIPETVKQLLYHPPDRPTNTNLEHIIAIAHPHGAPKTVTFGKRLGSELVNGVYSHIHTAKTCGGCSGTRLICTSDVNSLDSWRYSLFTHYAGQRGNVYNIKDDDGTVIDEVTSDTNNINYSVLW